MTSLKHINFLLLTYKTPILLPSKKAQKISFNLVASGSWSFASQKEHFSLTQIKIDVMHDMRTMAREKGSSRKKSWNYHMLHVMAGSSSSNSRTKAQKTNRFSLKSPFGTTCQNRTRENYFLFVKMHRPLSQNNHFIYDVLAWDGSYWRSENRFPQNSRDSWASRSIFNIFLDYFMSKGDVWWLFLDELHVYVYKVLIFLWFFFLFGVLRDDFWLCNLWQRRT